MQSQQIQSIPDEGKIDIHKRQTQYLRALDKLKRDELINSVNKELIINFIRECTLSKTVKGKSKRKIGPARCLKYIEILTRVSSWLDKSFDRITEKDIEEFIEALKGDKFLSKFERPYADETKADIKKSVKKFWKWKDGSSRVYPELARNISIDLREGNCRQILKDLDDNSVQLTLTDPPYFLDNLDDNWDDNKIRKSKAKAGVVGGLPVGMKFDPRQGIAFQKFFEEISKEIYRVLVPGAFFISFSQPRLFHRMAIATENVGFEIRDMFAWHYTKKTQFKAFSQNHFVDKMKISAKRKKQIKLELMGRKTAQLRPQFEALMLAQKPKQGTYVDNWLKWKVGLIDSTKVLNGAGSPSTVIPVEKAIKEFYNVHLSVKPVRLLRHLIELFTVEGQVVLDPFLGSGSTAIAAMLTGRGCIGIEIDPEYIKIAKQRLSKAGK